MGLLSGIYPDPHPFTYAFPCIQAHQPIGELYSGVIPHNILYDICEFDVRRVIYEERDVERYLGIQRPLHGGRVKEISNYVNYADASFPSAIIIAIDERCVEFDNTSNRMTIRNIIDDENPVPKRMIARVIDGQHRVAGLKGFNGDKDGFDCLVTVLVGMDIADQGHIFATVNLAQTKVNRSLAIDLYALEKSRSPMKTSHSVVVALDRNQGGPFYKKIKRLGVATEGRWGETLTQATVVDGLIGYISMNPDADRDALLRGQRLKKVDPQSERQLLFRNWFIDGDDSSIAIVYSNFFTAVREKWGAAWTQPGTGQILGRTTGYRALARLFGDAYLTLGGSETRPEAKKFKDLLDRVSLSPEEFSSDIYLPGSSGQSLLYRTMREQMLGR